MHRTRLRHLLALFLILLLAGAAAFPALADDAYDFSYSGVSEWGLDSADHSCGVMRLNGHGGEKVSAYCIDSTTTVKEGSKYARKELGDAGYPAAEAAKLRAVIQNAYPFITLETLVERCGIQGLTAIEAIAGVQLAIWHLDENVPYTHENAHVQALYEWLLQLPGADVGSVLCTIECTASYDVQETVCSASYRFRADDKNAGSSPVHLTWSFSRDLFADYQATVRDDGVGEDGFRTIKVEGLPLDASFSFLVAAEQILPYDAYFYTPEGGESASQSLIGAYQGKTRIVRELAFVPAPPSDFSLTILKQDSLTLAGLPGAVFELGNTEAFDDVVYTLTTGDDGTAVQGGLTEGTWYLREKTPPEGYIPYTGIIPVYIDENTPVQKLKNTGYGEIELRKVDDAGGPVAGAEFSIYAGTAVDPDKLLYSGLLSDDAGVILKGGLEPGLYTVVETKAPEGYHLNSVPKTVEVISNERVTVTIENPRIVRGKLNLYKRDAKTDEQLGGARLGVYRDAEFTDLVGEFVTKKTEPVSVLDLLPGTYYVKELAVPEGYYLDSRPQTVTLVEGETKAVTFYNHEIPHTAGNYGILFLAGGGLMLLFGAALLLLKKRASGRS